MDRDAVAKEQAKDLDRKHVKEPAPGKYGQYIEGWWAIAEANNIFGWDGWSYSIDRLEMTNSDPNQGRNSDQWAVGYICEVTVIIGGSLHRRSVGFGHGHAKAIGDAHESAAKEAETDALKRALRSFGWRFGLALYDKSKANVSDVAAVEADIKKAKSIWDADELAAFFKAVREKRPDIAANTEFVRACQEQKAAIMAKEKENAA